MTNNLPVGAVDVGVTGHFATVLVFVLVGFAFAGLALGVAKLLRPSAPNPNKLTTYECGELPRGSSWVRFNVRFYLIALFFIVFDVEIIFLFPWAVVFKQLYPVPGLGAVVFWEMVIFLSILSLGLAYVWVKGDLDWVKKLIERPGGTDQAAVPADEEVTAP
ncbi:MAG: NADH-quinone oxidoreductase subunit A [Krumholzibacteria bacterium]|nr:NADH-quinone oxidoreductase subunit A [Candidatus Krumholzibacteria bacterium]